MGLLHRAQELLLGLALKSLPVISTTGQRFAAPDRRAFEQQAQAYLNQVVLACIATRAQTLNEPPLTAVDSATSTVIPQHPLTRLFRRPNKHMSQSMFWQYVSTYVDIGGNCYIHKVRNVYGQVIELRPYHSGHIVPVSESGQWVDYYQYSYENVQKELDPRDIIHIRSYYIDPLNPVLGISPVRAAGINIDTYNELMQTLYSYLRNNGVPSGVLTVQQAVNAMQAESLKEQFQTNTTGRNRGKPIVLPSGMTYTQMGLDVSKMEAASQFAQYETAICGIYRVHPSVAMTMAGLQSSTYSNMQTAFQEYTSLTRVPTWNMWEEQVELSFGDEYPEVNVEFDTSNVAALQSDPDAVIYPVVATFNANIITVDEARQRMGFPPAAENGDKYSIDLIGGGTTGFLSAQQTTGTNQTTESPVPAQLLQAANNDVGSKWRALDYPSSGKIDQSVDVKAETFWNSMDKTVQDFAARLKKPTSELITAVGEVLIADAKKEGTKNYAYKANDPRLQVLIDRYMKSTGKWREDIVNEITKLAVKEVGADLTAVTSYIDTAIGDVTEEMAKNISDSIGVIQKDVQATVNEMAGSSADDIEAKLLEKFETLPQSRAAAIAKTTARATSTEVATQTWDTLNEDEPDRQEEIVKVWTTRRDGKVRASHRGLDGDWVEMNKKFANGTRGPGLGGAANEVVNCRCVLRPVRRKNL